MPRIDAPLQRNEPPHSVFDSLLGCKKRDDLG